MDPHDERQAGVEDQGDPYVEPSNPVEHEVPADHAVALSALDPVETEIREPALDVAIEVDRACHPEFPVCGRHGMLLCQAAAARPEGEAARAASSWRIRRKTSSLI